MVKRSALSDAGSIQSPQADPGGGVIPLAFIRGLGLLSPLGNLEQTWQALLAGDYMRDHGRVEISTCPGTSRVAALARRAAADACRHLPADTLRRDDTALVVGTSKGPVDDWLAPPAGAGEKSAGGFAPLMGLIQPAGIGNIAHDLARHFRIGGPHHTVSAACASGLHALIRATLMIRSGQARRVLVVAAESSLHPLFLATFKRLGVLAPPEIGCRPFDRSRRGFLVSEAAAAVMLEAWHPGELQPTPPTGPAIAVENFALGADAAHLTGGDPDGRTLKRLLSQVLAGRPVDLIHAHGTGTILNDATELAAIDAAAGRGDSPDASPPPAVYSHKGALGHSLGAAGLISVVLNCLAHERGHIPPNVRTTDPLAVQHVRITSTAFRRPVSRSLAVAAGFGGAMAVLTLRTIR